MFNVDVVPAAALAGSGFGYLLLALALAALAYLSLPLIWVVDAGLGLAHSPTAAVTGQPGCYSH
jgi:thiazole synthase ThiGH ThiG subunit